MRFSMHMLLSMLVGTFILYCTRGRNFIIGVCEGSICMDLLFVIGWTSFYRYVYQRLYPRALLIFILRGG